MSEINVSWLQISQRLFWDYFQGRMNTCLQNVDAVTMNRLC